MKILDFARRVFGRKVEENEGKDEGTAIAQSYVYQDYVNLSLSQPQLNIQGLFKSGRFYYIVCEGLTKDTLALNGQNMESWFRDYSTLGGSTRLAATIPANSEKVKTLTLADEANLGINARNQTYLYNDLVTYLPKDFPIFKISDENTGHVFINTLEALTPGYIEQLKECLRNLKESELIPRLVFRVNNIDTVKSAMLEDPILLQPTRSIFNKLDSSIKSIQEEDEDFWITNKTKLLNSSIDKKSILSPVWLTEQSSCLVSEYVAPEDIRNYLTLYNKVYLRMPINEHHETYIQGIGCTEKELKDLCSLGRVKLLFDQPLHRYHPNLHKTLLEIPKDAYLQSRKLASLNVLDLRKRVPFAFPTLDIDTKHELLHDLNKILSKSPVERNMKNAILEFLNAMWGNYFEAIERMGALGLARFGTYHFTNFIFEKANIDRSVELLDTEPGVNYAATLGANLITRRSVNDDALATLIANIYSGVPKDFIPGKQYESNTALNEILLVNSDIPVVELALAFQSNDIDRLRKALYWLTRHTKNNEELLSSVESFNDEVRHLVKKQEAISKLDITGFLLDGGTSLVGNSLPFVGWFAGLAVKGLRSYGAKKKTVSIVSDYLAAQSAGTIPDAVLIARMREDLMRSYKKSKYGY